jgi:hypothetical protein
MSRKYKTNSIGKRKNASKNITNPVVQPESEPMIEQAELRPDPTRRPDGTLHTDPFPYTVPTIDTIQLDALNNHVELVENLWDKHWKAFDTLGLLRDRLTSMEPHVPTFQKLLMEHQDIYLRYMENLNEYLKMTRV